MVKKTISRHCPLKAWAYAQVQLHKTTENFEKMEPKFNKNKTKN